MISKQYGQPNGLTLAASSGGDGTWGAFSTEESLVEAYEVCDIKSSSRFMKASVSRTVRTVV